jgi:hypothetical protein
MHYQYKSWGAVFAFLAATLSMAHTGSVSASEPDSIERGRYLVTIGGCNDCHTPGYMEAEGQVEESLWLTGDSLGWNGPWGTTFAPNLRLLMQGLSEDQWITLATNLKTRPPMPWFNLVRMADDDLRAIYRFTRYLGPGGQTAPAYMPPDQLPKPPYFSFVLPQSD